MDSSSTEAGGGHNLVVIRGPVMSLQHLHALGQTEPPNLQFLFLVCFQVLRLSPLAFVHWMSFQN